MSGYQTYCLVDDADVADLAGPWCFELLPAVVMVAVGNAATGANDNCADWLDCEPFALDLRGDCVTFKGQRNKTVHKLTSFPRGPTALNNL